MISRTQKLTVTAAVAVLALAGCGSSDDSSTGSADSSADGATSSAPTTPSRECTADDVRVQGGFGVKPTVTIPATCGPPSKLIAKDLVTGKGPAAKAGGTLTTNYLLVTWSDRQVLDTSFGREPFPIQNLGQAQVIEGWNKGLVGMKQGSRRLLIVPPDLGYGQGGNGIKPNETLVFVIDAVKVS